MSSFSLVLPELYLFMTVLGLILAESAHHEERVRLVLPTSLLGISGALIQTLLSYRGDPAQIFAATLSIDGFSLFFKTLFLVLAGVGVTSACLGDEVPREHRSEFCSLVLLGTLALMIAASASSLFVVVIALQLAGASGYFLAGFHRGGVAPAESSVKWLFSSLVSGVFLLVGALALFLLAGTANIYELHQIFASHSPAPVTILLVFSVLFLGLSIPLMIFPSQLWVPDVLQGANSPAGTFLVLGLRAGAFAVAVRLWVVIFSMGGSVVGKWVPIGGWDWTSWLAFSAGLTLMIPALLSIRQKNAKRLLACIAIVQSGYLLLGLLILEEVGLAAILFNLLVDLLAFGGLMFVLSLSVQRVGSDELLRLRGCFRGKSWEAVAFLLFTVSWLGLPPFAGSLGRFALLGVAIRREWFLLAFLGLAAFALTIAASGRLLLSVLNLGADPGADVEVAGEIDPTLSWNRRVFILALVLPLAGATIFAEWLLRWAGHSLRFIFW
jgi:NADH:ubiquinone oxidoreductase subunit 2 (subunit N)